MPLKDSLLGIHHTVAAPSIEKLSDLIGRSIINCILYFLAWVSLRVFHVGVHFNFTLMCFHPTFGIAHWNTLSLSLNFQFLFIFHIYLIFHFPFWLNFRFLLCRLLSLAVSIYIFLWISLYACYLSAMCRRRKSHAVLRDTCACASLKNTQRKHGKAKNK